MAKIVAEQLVDRLDAAGYVVMRKPPTGGHSRAERAWPLMQGLGPLSLDLARRFVLPHPDEDGMPKRAIVGPGEIGDLGDKIGSNPMHPG
jgi:hypothetical protein